MSTQAAIHVESRPVQADFSPGRRPVVLTLARQQDHHIEPFRNRLSLPVINDETWDPGILDQYDVAFLVVLSNDVWDSDRCLRAARRKRIPSLLLMDGILEFKHQWTNPRFAAGGGAPFLTPVLADKVACKGWNDVRRLEAWGNQGKCEIVGLPRLDRYLTLRGQPRSVSNPKRILVTSANTPWFTDEQRQNALSGFRALREFARARRDFELVWRLRRWIGDSISLRPDECSDPASPLPSVLRNVDAVITQASTVQLEAMLLGLPVAVLDFDNVPAFLPSAWRITSPSQIERAVDGLLDPEPARLSYQDECLHNELDCSSPAADRLLSLMEEMIAVGERAKREGVPLRLPARMLPRLCTMLFSFHVDLERQYPGHPTFGNKDLLDMQRRLAMAEQELQAGRQKLKRRSFGYWIERSFHSLGHRVNRKSH